MFVVLRKSGASRMAKPRGRGSRLQRGTVCRVSACHRFIKAGGSSPSSS